MIIDKFKFFESLSIGAIERGEHLATLNESQQLDEGILSSVANFFSRMLGGSVAKIDKILRKYKDNELDYWIEWADARGRYAEAEALSKEAKADPVDKMKYDEQKERVKKLQAQVEEKRKNVNDALVRQANHIIKDSVRLKDYWEMKKAKIDEEVAKESYNEVKKSTDNDTIHDLFDTEIQRAAKAARKKDEEFRQKYGSLSSGKFFDQAPGENEDLAVSGIKIKDLIGKPLTELQSRLKNIAAENLNDILHYLEKEVKKIKDQKEEDIKNIKNKVSDKIQQSREIDDINKKVKVVSDSIQSKIDYIDQLLLAGKGKKDDIKVPSVDDTKKTEVKEEPKKEEPKAEVKKEEPVAKKEEPVVAPEQIKKNFEEARGTIEEGIGEKLADDVYSHLKNDLVALYTKLLEFYKKENKDISQKTLQFGLIDFATELYKYKDNNNLLKKDLSQKDIDKQFDKYNK